MNLENLDYVSVTGTLIALAVIWVIVQQALKFTVRVFACGCAVIGGLALGVFVLVNWGEISKAIGLG